MGLSGLSLCKKIALPKVEDNRGNLTYVNGAQHVPFSLGRIYYLYDVPAGGQRGGHGHKRLEQVIVAVAGSFDVILDDGKRRDTFPLNRPYEGLYVAPMVWRELANFSSGAVCLVIASEIYDEGDYIRDYGLYLEEVGVS